MAVYRFTLEKIHIDNTRSRHQDTDTAAFAVRVGSVSTQMSMGLGDVNNGDHTVDLTSPPLFVPAGATQAVFGYMVYNGSTGNLQVSLDELVKRTIDDYVNQVLTGGAPDPRQTIPDDPGVPDNATFDDPGWVEVLGLAAIGSFVFPDCDGVVAADVVGRSKDQLDSAIDQAGGSTFTQTRRYPGTDSPAGCGSNSDYSVTWTIGRDRESGPGALSLRQFVTRNALTLSPGLRSLTAGGPLSVRDLLT